MDPHSFAALMRHCRSVAGFLNTVDFDELADCAARLNASDAERLMIAILADAARRMPPGHP